jgi:hypothetical protein
MKRRLAGGAIMLAFVFNGSLMEVSPARDGIR